MLLIHGRFHYSWYTLYNCDVIDTRPDFTTVGTRYTAVMLLIHGQISLVGTRYTAVMLLIQCQISLQLVHVIQL